VDHIAGCCQCFRKDLFNFNIKLDSNYGKFWLEDTDFSLQVLELNKINYRIRQIDYLKHTWGGSGNSKDLLKLKEKNYNYFINKWEQNKNNFSNKPNKIKNKIENKIKNKINLSFFQKKNKR